MALLPLRTPPVSRVTAIRTPLFYILGLLYKLSEKKSTFPGDNLVTILYISSTKSVVYYTIVRQNTQGTAAFRGPAVSYFHT